MNLSKHLDIDGNGFISRHELKFVLISSGEGISEKEIDQIIFEVLIS